MAILLSAFAPSATALPAVTLGFSKATLTGQQELHGESKAFTMRSPEMLPQAKLSGFGEAIRVRTENVTSPSVAQVAVDVQRQRDGATTEYRGAQIAASSTFSDLDIFIVPAAGMPLPEVKATAGRVELATPAANAVTETGHVDGTRPLLHQDVGGTLSATASAATVRIEGSFVASIWSWNFTVRADSGEDSYVTGAYRLNPVSDPLLGTPLTWTAFQQVAVVEISHGWLELAGIGDAESVIFATPFEITGLGSMALEGTAGLIGGQEINGAPILASGRYLATASATDTPQLQLRDLVGQVAVDGIPVDLGDSGALRDGSAVARQTGPSWTWLLAIVGLMAFAVLVKGPAQMSRFNRIQQRFESKDYIGVLARIDPFTRRAPFRRKATFLKAVSLLSLEEYKEASLFLQTLGPAEAPEPATKSFLQACAAAGLGQDDAVLQFLSACFRDDPSYIDEARTVPTLAGYLPYFALTTKEEAAT